MENSSQICDFCDRIKPVNRLPPPPPIPPPTNILSDGNQRHTVINLCASRVTDVNIQKYFFINNFLHSCYWLKGLSVYEIWAGNLPNRLNSTFDPCLKAKLNLSARKRLQYIGSELTKGYPMLEHYLPEFLGVFLWVLLTSILVDVPGFQSSPFITPTVDSTYGLKMGNPEQIAATSCLSWPLRFFSVSVSNVT